MRLDPQEKAALENAIRNVDGEVFLFGSRVEDDKKGGDIDILIFSPQNPFKLSQKVSVDFFKLCEEKIDVVVMNPVNLNEEQRAFLKVLNKKKIK